MEHQVQTNKWQIIAKFSLVYSLILIAQNLIFYILDIMGKFSMLNVAINIIVVGGSIYFGIMSLRNNTQKGYISYGKGVSTGLWIALFASIILTLYYFVFTNFIDPDFVENMMNEAKRKMIEEGKSEEDIEKMMMVSEKMKAPWVMALGGFIGNMFYGLLASLIVSIFTRKEDPDAEYNALND